MMSMIMSESFTKTVIFCGTVEGGRLQEHAELIIQPVFRSDLVLQCWLSRAKQEGQHFQIEYRFLKININTGSFSWIPYIYPAIFVFVNKSVDNGCE